MFDTASDIIVALISMLGAGGLGAVIVNAFAGRKRTSAEVEKIKADAIASLSEVYDRLINTLAQRTTQLESKIEQLETQISETRMLLSDRDATILVLQKENANLQEQLDKMQVLVKGRDKRILELEHQVTTLIERLNALNGGDSHTHY